MTVKAETAPGPLAALDRATGWIPFILSVAASTTIMATMLLVVADVLSRNLFQVPINGTSDFVAFSIVACVFAQLGSTIRDGRLITAEFLMGDWELRRPVLANGAKAVFFAIATLLLWRAFVWLSADFMKAWITGQFTGAVGAYQIALWPFKLAVAIGALVALYEAGRRTVIHGLAAVGASRHGGIGDGRIGLVVFLALLVSLALFMTGGSLSPVMVGVTAFVGLFFLVACGMPVAFALLAMSFLGVWLTRDNIMVATNALGIATSGAVRSFEFGVVPLFVTMGLILDRADVGRDAFQVGVVLLRRVKGGLGIATVLANAIFAAITGSSIASAAVFSRIAVPPMVEAGYTRRFAAGVVAGSSVLGMLIPPSLLLIIYGLLAEASIGALFIAAIVPGILLAGLFGVLNVAMAHFTPGFVGTPRIVEGEEMPLGRMLVNLLPVVFIVTLVMGGIYGGFFSPTEAGAIGAFGAILVALARRKLPWRVLKQVTLETGYITASILFLIVAANLYARMLALSTIPSEATGLIAGLGLSLLGFMFAYMVLVILLGMILDSVSIMLVILPVALPVVHALGGDLVWFGVVSVIAIEIGLLTPPFGLSVFVVKGSLPPGFASLGEIFAGALPFVVTMILFTILLILVPSITLVLL